MSERSFIYLKHVVRKQFLLLFAKCIIRIYTVYKVSLAELDARPTGDQVGAGSTSAGLATF